MSDKKENTADLKSNQAVKKETQKFVGIVTRPWTIQANKDKNRKAFDYKVGDKFETTNKKVFESLINNNRIRKT